MKAYPALAAVLRVIAMLCSGTAAACLSAVALGAQSGCDRQCLIGFASVYAAALVEHAPARVPTASGVRFTENLVPLKFGEQGLWKTVTGRRDFNIYAADPQTGNVVWIGIVKENELPVMTTARLKVTARRIAEIETLVGRSPLTAAATVAAPRPDFASPVPPAEQPSRDQLIAIANSNWNAMERGDGHLAPYAIDCERYDNGEQTSRGPSPAKGAPDSNGEPTDRSCFGQMNSGRFNNGNKVYPLRIWAVDREYGLVVGLFTPNVPGNVREIKLRNGKTLAPEASRGDRDANR